MTDFAYWRMKPMFSGKVHGTFGPQYPITYCELTVEPSLWERTGQPITCHNCKKYLDTNYPWTYQPEEKEGSHGIPTA